MKTATKNVLLLIAGLLVQQVIAGQTPTTRSDKLIRQLKTQNGPAARQRLILQLAALNEAQVSPAQRQSLIPTLLEWYRMNPDPGVHSALDYLLRPTHRGNAPRNPAWMRAVELDKIDRSLRGLPPRHKHWYLTSEGHTMTLIRGPVSFSMGSPESETDREKEESLHRVHIPRSFAISTKEITVAQFQRFFDNNPAIRASAKADADDKDPTRESKKLQRFSPDEQCPQILITWYEATQYCNWLSKQAGIPETEWVYPSLDSLKTGMRLPEDHLKRTGYRLPTEAEWEFACRAGSQSSRFYGSSPELLADYAWFSKKPLMKKGDSIDPDDPHHTHPVGQLKPNPLGLFDVYGNVWEWCDSPRIPYRGEAVDDEPKSALLITDSLAMVRRGGSFSYGQAEMRSAHRGAIGYLPSQRRDNVGFRIARTLP